MSWSKVEYIFIIFAFQLQSISSSRLHPPAVTELLSTSTMTHFLDTTAPTYILAKTETGEKKEEKKQHPAPSDGSKRSGHISTWQYLLASQVGSVNQPEWFLWQTTVDGFRGYRGGDSSPKIFSLCRCVDIEPTITFFFFFHSRLRIHIMEKSCFFKGLVSLSSLQPTRLGAPSGSLLCNKKAILSKAGRNIFIHARYPECLLTIALIKTCLHPPRPHTDAPQIKAINND